MYKNQAISRCIDSIQLAPDSGTANYDSCRCYGGEELLGSVRNESLIGMIYEKRMNIPE